MKTFWISFFAFVLFNYQATAKGALDYRFETFARTTPVGAYLRGELGYAQTFWGKGERQNPLYGMIRPSIRLQTSGIINSADAKIEFYPISFLGLYVGKSFMSRQAKNLDGFNCDVVICKASKINRNLWGAQMALKVGNFFSIVRYQFHSTEIKDKIGIGAGYAEEQGTLIGSGTKDTLLQALHVLGFQYKRDEAVAVLFKRNFTKNSRLDSTMTTLLWRKQLKYKKNNDATFMFGPGAFHTHQGSTHPTIMAVLQYNPRPGLTLF
jgi:hypothetical protein